MTYELEPECLNCSYRSTDRCDLDPRIEIAIYLDHVETPEGCPLLLEKVNEMVKARLTAGQTRKGDQP